MITDVYFCFLRTPIDKLAMEPDDRTNMHVSYGELREQAWNFFQMQAGQRLMTFNYYVLISSLLCTGLASSFKDDPNNSYLGASFGFLLILFSFVFWKLDCRNNDLIKGSEEALKFFERSSDLQDTDGMPHIVKRFSREEFITLQKRQTRTWKLWRNSFTYSECFGFVFAIFSIVGLLGFICSIFRLKILCN